MGTLTFFHTELYHGLWGNDRRLDLFAFAVTGFDIPELEATSFDTSSRMLLIISTDTTLSPDSASFNLSSIYMNSVLHLIYLYTKPHFLISI